MSKSGHVYTDKATKQYEGMIATEWARQNGGLVFDGPMMVVIRFFFARPKSHYDSKGLLKPGAPKHFTHVPDLDNIEKAVLDGLNGVAYTDDKLIIIKDTQKEWRYTSGVEVWIMKV